jgi:high-affinity nickel-transport protein
MTAATVDMSSRWNRFRYALTPREWTRVAGMVGFIVLLNVLGWGVLAAFVAPHHYDMGASGVFGIGLGATAYTLGMRHAFDADHIAAIDNTTRKLLTDGQRPLSVGFWFSLGHSTIVFLLSLLLSLGVRALNGQVQNDSSTLHQATGVIGTAVSGTFLYIIGIINLVVLVGIIKVFMQMRRGSFDEAALEQQLNNRGFMNRFLNRVTKAVRKPWQMYPTGVLFGLGFDTATEVALLVLAAGAAAVALPWYAILVLPVLFAAGMSMFDTADGCFMNFAYGWAFAKPVRKVFYNITVTALSVAVALIIGTIELISILTNQLSIDSGPLAAIANVNLNNVGFFIVGLFVVTWVLALAVWRFARIEDRWTARLKAVPDHAATDEER